MPSFRNPIQRVTVDSGDTVCSTNIDMRGLMNPALVAPGSVGLNAFLQVSIDQTSANFGRLQLPTPNSGDWMVTSPPPDTPWGVALTAAAAFPFARVELGAAVTDTRTFSIIGKEGLR